MDAVRFRFPLVTILEAENLAQGRRALQEEEPQSVFLDIGLPDGNGLDLADLVRDERPGTTVVVCTSHDLPEYRKWAQGRGAAHFFCKGDLDWDEIGDIVAREMGRQKGLGALAAESPLGPRGTGEKDKALRPGLPTTELSDPGNRDAMGRASGGWMSR